MSCCLLAHSNRLSLRYDDEPYCSLTMLSDYDVIIDLLVETTSTVVLVDRDRTWMVTLTLVG